MSSSDKKITIKDIARICNLSSATISRVLNNSPNVLPETREKVLKVIKEYDFQPNKIAKFLRTKKSDVVALIVNQIENPYTALLVSMLESKLKSYNKSIILMDIKGDLNQVQYFLNILESFNVNDFIIQIPYLSENIKTMLNKYNKNFILYNSFSENNEYKIVSINNYKIGQIAARMIKKKNLENVILLGGDIDKGISESFLRYKGFCKEFYNISDDEILAKKEKEIYFDVNFDYKIGYEKINEIINSSHKTPIVFFCFSDLLAISAMNCLYDNNLSIGKDYFIIGVDGIYISQISRPYKITTLKHPFEKMAEKAVDLIVKEVEKEKTYYFDPVLIKGDTF